MPLTDILAQQKKWARARWSDHDGPRAPSIAENLVCPMSPEFAAQFSAGNGSELGRDGTPGKMQSLRSSSALAFNVFAPWHGKDLSSLSLALKAPVRDRAVEFEKKFRHGLSSAPPNLDVVLDAQQTRPLAIESKFSEPYGRKAAEPELDPKYFPSKRERWSDLGMPRCQKLARALGTEVSFTRLGAGQLLKHVLGLAHTTGQRPRLLCAWFDTGCEEARVHRDELERFHQAIGDEVEFSHRTYQEIIAELSLRPEPIPGYGAYLRARYAGA